MEKEGKVESLFLLLLCALCWGPSYLFIKIAVSEIPPITIVFMRVVIGCAFLFMFCLWQKQKLLKWKSHWKQFVIMGITLNVIPFTLISYSELYISSALAGILNSMTLIFTAIFAHFFGVHDGLTKNKIGGIIIGILGLSIIYWPFLIDKELGRGLGALLMICACLSYGAGTVYARTHLQKVPGMVALTAQLLIASIILLPFSLWVNHSNHLSFPSSGPLFSALGLGVISTAGGFFFYYRTIQVAGATFAALAVLVVPILAMILGASFLHERISWNLYLGTACILAGVLIVNSTFGKKKPKDDKKNIV